MLKGRLEVVVGSSTNEEGGNNSYNPFGVGKLQKYKQTSEDRGREREGERGRREGKGARGEGGEGEARVL